MNKVIFLACFVLGPVMGYTLRNNRTEKEKLYGGDLVDISDTPYMATFDTSVWLNKVYPAYHCGAVIISPSWLLTASSCIDSGEYWRPKYVYVGSTWNGDGDKYRIRDLRKHPQHHDLDAENDIALIKLDVPLDFNENVQAAPIAAPNNHPVNNFILIVAAGYPAPVPHGSSNVYGSLGFGLVRVLDFNDCKNRYWTRKGIALTDGSFCALDENVDVCIGDTGSPVFFGDGEYGFTLAGIVTSRMACRGSENLPSVFTKVSKYYDWILQTVGNEAEFIRGNSKNRIKKIKFVNKNKGKTDDELLVNYIQEFLEENPQLEHHFPSHYQGR